MGRWLRRLAWLAVAGVLAIAAFVSAIWMDHRAATTLPTPSGPLLVGRSIQAWTDGTVDTFAPTPGTTRMLQAWIWYPAAARSGALPGDYLPPPLLAETNRSRVALIRLLTRDLSKVHTHGTEDADLSAKRPTYPVLLMRAGASAGVANYTALAEDLASHGYVVVGVDAPYRTSIVVLPDGRSVTRTPENDPELCIGRPDMASCADRILSGWTGDLRFVLDRLEQMNTSGDPATFAGRLDLTRVGVFGHSFGGAATARFCLEDARCKAAVDVDGALHGRVIAEGVRQPFMFLLSDHGEASDVESRQILADIQAMYDRLPAATRHRIAIRGGQHFLFSDDGALFKSPIVQRMLRVLGISRIEGRRQLAITAFCLRTFFDAYLQDTPSRPQIASLDLPEIVDLDVAR
jgi:dienelactone hydrolase